MSYRKPPENTHTRGGSDQDRAREVAYKEYLSLRVHSSDRGGYVMSDTLYGAYVSGKPRGRGPSSVENTPYGASDMRRKAREQQEREERERYLRERAAAGDKKSRKEKRREPVAEQGRVNKADKMTRAEKKEAKREAKRRAKGGAPAAGLEAGAEGTKKKRKKKGRGLKIALIITLILVIGIGGTIAAGFAVVKNTLDNVGRIELDPDMIGINPQVDSELRDYRNIALLGIDARDMKDDSNVRSDAIIVASINKKTDEIKMFSVYRDTMLDLGDDSPGLDKVTHGYFYGGPTKMLYALNKNLDLNIKEVVVVNWKSVADTVDALGGLDIEIQESEIKEMNKYIQDTYNNIGGSNEKIKQAGMQTLNGNQAVTYARIRKDSSEGDYRRNERMKIVVKAAFQKAKKMNVNKLEKISDDILPEIKTNLSSGDMMKMMIKLNSYKMTDSVGWPYEVGSYSDNGWFGPPVTLESNVSELHEQFFGQEGYVPTQDVQKISKRISARTGLY